MDRVRQDIRSAFRMLRGSPVFALVAIISIAIGIGANTTVFSIVNTTFFAPLPFRDADRLYDIYEHNPREVCAGCGVGTSYALYTDVTARLRSFSELGAYRDQEVIINDGGTPLRVRGGVVSASLLHMFGFVPLTGRLIQPEDDRPGAARVALVSESLWRVRYHSDPSLVGRFIRINGDGYTVIGVLPESARFPRHAAVWLPMAPLFAGAGRGERTIGVVGALQGDAAAAHAELAAIGQARAQQFPDSNEGWTLHAAPLRADLAGDYSGMWGLLGAVVFVLLVACANLAGLLLARGAARRRELGVRLALGAGRGHIVRLLLTESLLIAVLGGALGLLAAWWAIDLISNLAASALPFWDVIRMDVRVLAFTLLLTVLTGLGVGLLPALDSARVDIAGFVKEGHGSTQAARATRLRRVLVGAEIAAAMLLLTGAGLTTKSFLRTRSLDPGFSTENLMRGELRLVGSGYEDHAVRARVVQELLTRLARVPGVQSVGASSLFIVDWPEAADRGVVIEGVSDELASATVHHAPTVSPDYFGTLGVSVLTGRAFAATDVAGAPMVAVVNQVMATRIWPNQSPLGKRIKLGHSAQAPWLIVVGVVANTRQTPRQNGTYIPLLYLPFAQHPQSQPANQPVTLEFRTAGNASGLARAVAAQVNDVDAQLALESFGSVDDFQASWARPFRMIVLLMSGLTSVALILALMGVYGIAAFSVARRSREIGIRMALGATARDAARLVLGEGMWTSVIGVAAGLLAAQFLTRLISSLLFGVSPTDPIVFALMAVALILAALFASWWPARQAMRIDPAATLRME